jgi:hypothetical protein
MFLIFFLRLFSCFVCLFSVLYILRFCIVLCIFSPFVYIYLFPILLYFTDTGWKPNYNKQISYIISYNNERSNKEQ